MIAVRVWFARVIGALTGRRRDQRLDEEVRDHLQRLTDDGIARGLSPADAALAARRAFGGVDQVTAACRDQRGWPWLASVGQDMRFAVRHLVRERAFSGTLLAVLALGIGVGHLFFSLTYAARLRGLPIPDVDRVLWVSTLDAGGADRGLSYPEFVALRDARQSFARLAAYVPGAAALGDDGRAPDRLEVAFTTADAFAVADVRAIAGRLFDAGDERPGAPVALVLTARIWRARYGADPAVLGREVRVDGAPATVVGVVADHSGYPSPAAAFLPLAARADLVSADRAARSLRVLGRLAPGRTPLDAAVEAETIAAGLTAAFPDSNAGVRFRVVPITARLIGGMTGWWPFVAAGVIVIAVAAANAGNLLLAAALGRAREVALRTAMGARRARIVRQLLVESLVTATVAAVAGLAVSRAGVALFSSAVPDGTLPYWFDFSFDATTFAALWLITLAVAVVSAVGPALYASRVAALEVLKDGGRTEIGRRTGRRGATALLAVQLALAVVLVAQVGTAALRDEDSLATDALLEDPAVLTGAITLPASRYTTAHDRRAFFTRLDETLRARPGVTAVAFASVLPVEGAPDRGLLVEGRRDEGPTPIVHVVGVSPGYFSLLGAGIVRGRDVAAADGRGGEPVVMVNERLAHLHFPGLDPLGRRIALRADAAAAPRWHTVIAVVPDIRLRPGRPGAMPIVYTPIEGSASAALIVRGERAGLTAEVREALRGLDADVPLSRARSLPMAVRDATWVARVSARLASTVSLAAFALATFGLFAVVSHRVALRGREIGLRMALGAGRRRIAALVMRSVGGALAAGLVLGLLGVAAWDRAFAPSGPEATPATAATFAAGLAALAAAVLAGGLMPLRRAVRVAPADALRRE
ncbi:MAG: ABC transporter permease [Vicinamibacterales bacterium]